MQPGERRKICYACDRRKGANCGIDGVPINDHVRKVAKCPDGRYGVTVSATDKMRAMWRELHTRRLTDPVAELAWLDRFARRLVTCNCRVEWKRWLTDNPPDMSSEDAYFVWSVFAHNSVNARLGKPLMSIEAAREMYGR